MLQNNATDRAVGGLEINSEPRLLHYEPKKRAAQARPRFTLRYLSNTSRTVRLIRPTELLTASPAA